MRRLRYVAKARRDFAEIALGFYERGVSEKAAEAFLAGLETQCQRLAANPGIIGQSRENLGPSLRSFAYRRHLIVFRYDDDLLEVVRIVYGGRDLDSLFQKEEV